MNAKFLWLVIRNGINSIGVLYGFGSEEDLREAGATYIVEKLTDILEIK